MLALPPYALLIVFGLFLAGFLFFSIANIILLARFGARNAIGLMAAFGYVCGAAIILFLTWHSLRGVDWKTPVQVLAVEMPKF